ncbi:restriction endonuclease subunit S [Algoriphagus mannitolivorans]|uniref:restriction endonuclease subunit S n=1 Tax=Algoriphagus mannitolivorans TaxID=226504 RepID=UPI0003FD5B12|nr:restriction endonuclease subunit S [Algoriphagus mannitolivorans]
MVKEVMNERALNINMSNWTPTKLGDVLDDISKRVDNPSQSEYDRFVGLEHFISGDIRIKNWGSTENLTSSTKAFKAGDILFARRNAYLRRSSLVDFDGCCSGDAFVLRENLEKVVPGFMAFVINSNALWDYANENAAGTMSQRVKWRDLANYEFLLPPKSEQARLAELLWAMDEVIDTNLKSQKSLDAFYASTRENEFLKKGNTNALLYNSRLKEDVNIDIQFIKLGQVLTDIKYGTSRKGNTEMKGVPVLGIPNVVDERLSLNNLNYAELEGKELESCKLTNGDIVIVRTNGNPEYTGKTALYNINEGHAFASYLIKISVDKNLINPEFLVRFLQTRTARRYFRRHATSTAGNYNINTETIKSIIVPVLPKEKQNEIVLKLQTIEDSMSKVSDLLIRSNFLQKSLINQIF